MEIIGAAIGAACIGFIALAAIWPIIDDRGIR